MAKMKTWVAVVIAIVICLVIAGVAMVGGSVYWVTRHVETQFTSSDRAAEEFSQARARFAGQQPLVEIRGDHHSVVHKTPATAQAGRVEIKQLHAMFYDPRPGKLVRVAIPFWLVRMMPGGRVRFGDRSFDNSMENRLTVDDVERRGPGLLVDGSGAAGEQVIAWTE